MSDMSINDVYSSLQFKKKLYKNIGDILYDNIQ